MDGKMWIGGRWTTGDAAGWIAVENPATGATVGRVAAGTVRDAETAVKAARRAQPAWEKLPPATRAAFLRRLAALLDRDSESLAALITAEQGKPLAQARGEVGGAIGFIEFAADNARRIEGEIVPSDNPGEEIWIRRDTVGVVVGLTAWNFPVALAGRKLGPALAAGCTIVLKSHELTPLSLVRFAELCEEAGIPPGVVNVVSGSGREIGAALVSAPETDLVTLTGSTRAGREIFAAAASGLKILRLEMGGKAPFLVMPDCDLDAAAEALVASRMVNCGQVCTCPERVYVHRRVYDAFVEKVVARVSRLTVGDPKTDVDLGPKVSSDEAAKVTAMVDAAILDGAEALNRPAPPDGPGHWSAPTVLTVPSNDLAIMRDEIFGPVVPILSVDNYESALACANDTVYGLSAYLWTRDHARLMDFARRSHFGELYLNRGAGEAFQGFHTGRGQSSLGGEDGRHGLDAYSHKRTVYLGALEVAEC